MLERIKSYIEEVELIDIEKSDAESIRLKYLSRKGILNDLFEDFKKSDPSVKKDIGKLLNELKNKIQDKIDQLQSTQSNTHTKSKKESIDFSMPVQERFVGGRHPLKIVEREVVGIFERLGFELSEGPEIEDDWHNFSALNFPENHPARDMQDTFFIDKEIALRTHTSSVQVRIMENGTLPIRAIMPGRVYRNEAISVRANCFFHQIEGIYIDKNVSFAELKETLFLFVKELFGNDVKVRFRPSYFPFTEPSAEMDISCLFCKGNGCTICKHSNWVEILGCGMIDPNVLKNNGIDPEIYSGYAFGMGIERIAMLKYDVKDLRMYFSNDMRFLSQFSGLEE